MNIFDEIKARLTMPDVVRGYGIDINRSGFCICPFHAEKTPSMKIYEKGFKCFGCNEGGDAIAFVQKLFNLSNPLEAANKINSDFGLNIDVNQKPSRQEFISTKNLIAERQAFEKEEKAAFNAFSDYFKTLRTFGQEHIPSEGQIPDKRFIEYLQNFERIDYTVNQMIEIMHNPIQERKAFLKDNEEYLVTVAERLLEIRQEDKEHYQDMKNDEKESPQQAVKKTIVINAFGGPGSGKTTACLQITAALKKRGFVTEYVQEYAKELVWDKNLNMLDGSEKNQKMILAEQTKRMDRLVGKVDFIVTDSPILLNSIYLNSPNKEAYTKNLVEKFNTYNNFCFVVNRDASIFEQPGRLQNLEQSIVKDNEITQLLRDNKIYFKEYSHDDLDKVVTNSIRTHERITGIKQEIPVGERIKPKTNAVGDTIGNTPYKFIDDKSYLKYSNTIAPQIADSLNKNGIRFSGKVYSNLTTFTVNRKDQNRLKSIAEDVTKRFTDRNRPQLIPTPQQQRHQTQKQMAAKPRQQEMSL